MRPSTSVVGDANREAVEHYKTMRAALMDASEADRALCEIVITSQMALLGLETPFKVHAIRLFEANVSKATLQQVILAGLGVTFLIGQAARALEWIDEAHKEFNVSGKG